MTNPIAAVYALATRTELFGASNLELGQIILYYTYSTFGYAIRL